MTSILIIDDDIEFCSMLRDYLTSHDIDLSCAHDGEAGLAAVHACQYDLILLDVMLPDIDGFEVLSRLRKTSPLNVLLLSAQGNEANRIAGLDIGADDYLPKPFNPRELVARIRAILRRSERNGGAWMEYRESEPPAKGIAVNSLSRQAFYRGNKLPLTDVEFALLNIFLGSPGEVLEREDVQRVFHRPFNPLDRSLDMHISRLRKKLAVVEELVDPIKTIRSSGYLFTPESAQLVY